MCMYIFHLYKAVVDIQLMSATIGLQRGKCVPSTVVL